MTGPILTWRQTLVLQTIDCTEVPHTATEIANTLQAPVSSIRGCLKALERRGLVAVKGASTTGGRTWGRVEPQ